ncbi:MAG TPA: sugar transferase [Chloroflexi bacterium]|nr:sugar transferase [Chloroflexota bacterium]HBY09418.1 sugar transferase [Chloroflexota bacterium]
MIGIAFRLAYWIRFQLSFNIFKDDVYTSFSYYQVLSFVLVPTWIALYIFHGLYQKQYLLGGTQEYDRVFRASSISTLIVIVAGFIEPSILIARGWLLIAWPLTFFFPALSRFTLRRVVYHLRKHGYFLTPAVIIGGNEEGRWLAEQLLSWRTSGLLLVGFVDEKVNPGTHLFGNLFSLGTVDDLDEVITKYNIGELILATSAISSRNKQMEIFKKYGVSGDVNVRMSSGLYEIITTGITVSELANAPFITINKARLTGWDEVLKMFLDYAITIPGLIIISPFLLLIALAIKLDSPGPAIHRRQVMGMNGKKFFAYKFRTMYVNGNEILEAYPELKAELVENQKLKNDPRVTRIGNFLRKASMDELPQLFNVIRREMSLVGPRMISPPEVEKYQQWNINLLTVRPGITGPWQVSGRSDISYKERVQIDMYYVRNWSIWLDIQILIQTIPAVLKSRGAY